MNDRDPQRVPVWRLLLAGLLLRRKRSVPTDSGADRTAAPDGDRSADAATASLSVPGVQQPRATRRAELLLAVLLMLAGGLGIAFCLIYAFLGGDTQLLGLALGLALLVLAAAFILAAQRVFVQQTAVEPRPRLAEARRPTEREVAGAVTDAGQGLSRRRLLLGAASLAGAGLGAAAIVPLDSLGPNVGATIDTTPWKLGIPLVSETGRLLSAEDVIEGSFETAFPQGADRRELGSPVVVVRVDPSTLRLPASRTGWAPEGILAFSKICTHAGCAVSLYRAPLNEETSQPPALVCPCHYSTFDVRRAAAVEFGPAGRPLPQLPLAIRADRVLIAAGGFSGPVGPGWWSVRREGPTKSR